MGKKIQYIGRYVMDGTTLGKGNFAKVELATHGLTEVKVAIKVIDTRKIKEEYVRQNLHREAKIMSQLHHPNIIRLYETLKATTLYCLVLEYAAGGELLHYIKSQEGGRLTDDVARTFMRQLTSAIHYLHERDVVHRDLKMENIMLDDKKKNIKLIDFGLSNIYNQNDPLKTHCGSPEYAAPELFVVGKTYGPEIDVWSLGIILYAMVQGKLPFTAPYKDEYMRMRLLQAITRGLSSYHEREMQPLGSDCRHLLHRLIEPNPESRIPLAEILHHPWLTGNGKLPFSLYQPPPKDKQLRRQVVGELCIMMNLKRKHVDETVKEHRADELSAMFNMLSDRHKKVSGMFDKDHTVTIRKCKRERDSRSRSRERDKLGQDTPESQRGRDFKDKGKSIAHRKVPKSSTPPGKSGMNTRDVVPPSDLHVVSDDDEEKVPVRLDPGPEPDLLPVDTLLPSSSQHHEHHEHHHHHHHHTSASAKPKPTGALLGVPSAALGSGEKSTPTANGPTRIPLSQRRQPPAKLNLTLDLSVTNSWPTSRRTVSVSSSIDGEKDSRPGSTVGIAASSGVPAKLTTISKIPVLSPTKKDSSSKGLFHRDSDKRPFRPNFLQYCRKSRTAESRESVQVSESGDKVDKGKEDTKCMVAPKATPEDSVIDSYSTSSDEEPLLKGLGQVLQDVQPTAQVPMQPEMLNVSDDEKIRLAKLSQAERLASNPLPVHGATKTGETCTLQTSPTPLVKLKGRRPLLAKHLSESEHYDSSASSQSGCHIPPHLETFSASGSSLPARFPATKPSYLWTDSGELPCSSSCLPTNVQMPLSTTCLLANRRLDSLSSSNEMEPTPPCRHQQHTSNPSKSRTLGNPHKLRAQKGCFVCGLSPGSPTYYEKHSKFCHTGAHALDVFVSPDEVPSPTGPLWRPVASATGESPTQGCSSGHSSASPVFHFPKVVRPVRVPMQPAVATVETFGITDDSEYDDEEDMTHTKPLLAQPCRKCPVMGTVSLHAKNTSDRRSPASSPDRPCIKHKPTVTNTRQRTANRERRKVTNNGVYTQIPDTSLQLVPAEDGSSESLAGSVSSHHSHHSHHAEDSTEKQTVTGNTEKTHPVDDKDEESSTDPPSDGGKSRIPRPAGRFAKLQVFHLLHHKDKDDRSDSERLSSNPSSPERGKKSDRHKLLRQHDHKSRHMSWRQGLSHLLRIKKPGHNSNNNVSARKNRENNTAGSGNGGNGSGTLTVNSVSGNGSSGGKKRISHSQQDYYQDMDAKWTAPASPQHKCNSLQVTSSPIPSNAPTPAPPMYELTQTSSCTEHKNGSPQKVKAGKRVNWTGCKECAHTEQESGEGVTPGLGRQLDCQVPSVLKGAVLPTNATNHIKASHMTSNV